MRSPYEYVFGYGSLIDVESVKATFKREVETESMPICQLSGYRRTWNVAMDNSQNHPGYKFYVDVESGERPEICVAFLNVRRSDSQNAIAGRLIPVTPADLIRLDMRERSYRRIAVGDKLDRPINGIVWLYVATTKSKELYLEGLRRESIVISKRYYNMVVDGYHCLGKECAKDYYDTTDKPTVPLRELRVVRLPK